MTRSPFLVLASLLLGPLATAWAAPGDIVWVAKEARRDLNVLAVADGTVVVGSPTDNAGLRALSLADGKPRWGPTAGKGYTMDASAEAGLAAMALLHPGPPGSVEGVDLKTGSALWRRAINAINRRHPDWSVSLVGGKLLVPDSDASTLWALEPRTGQPLWRFAYGPGPGHCETRAVESGGVIYWSGGENDQDIDITQRPTGNFLFALDAATGQLRWKRAVKAFEDDRLGACIGAPLVVGDRVVATAGHRVFAVDAASGEPIWQTAVEQPGTGKPYVELSPLAHTSGIVAVATHDAVFGLAASDGQLRWTHLMDEGMRAWAPVQKHGLAAADGLVYLSAAQKNRLVAESDKHGLVYTTGPHKGAPAPGDELWALTAATGELAWKARLPGWRATSILPLPDGVLCDTDFAVVRIQR